LLTAIILTAALSWAADIKSELIEKVPFYRAATRRFAPLYPAFAQQMLQDYGVTKGIVVDVGASVGMFAMEYAKVTQCTVYALDIDPNPVRLCGILVDEAGLSGRVIPIEGDAQNMPFKDEFADLVFSRGSILFWPDREAGVRECYRILKPGGVAYIGGGFTSILAPEIRNPLAEQRAQDFKEDPKLLETIGDLDEVAVRAGIPAGQWRFIKEPIAGWWLEIKKPPDHTAWYRRWNAQFKPWHKQMAAQIVERYKLKRGRALEIGWGAGSLALQLAPITDLQLYVVGHDPDAAKVANEQAQAAGYAGRIQAVSCDEDHLIFDDNTFDVIVGHAGAAVWENPERVYREIIRVLRPRGVALLGTGAPLVCTQESSVKFSKLAKSLRTVPDAPTKGFQRCPDRATVENWLAEAGAQGKVISADDIHNQWVEIRK
jgi:ubiquinone/menaquinone biosynthesis C-methylase UbiE